MANEPTETSIGGRLQLIDPNNFDNLYNGGVFGDSNYNMSVPLEDLSIMVGLTTKTKNRTILNTENNVNTRVSTGNGGQTISVDFIKGVDDPITGKNYLTTSYTELSTELKDIDETLGITNINIDFNSSYAPMINIDFVDVRGGSIFQNGGKSKYNVFFQLPYPIFELTIKGYYGKPVTYCLHLVKCNTKFNSQSGNFEIAAQFVGYTYAMLSDMLIGYLKAAGITKAGQSKLDARGILSIKDFLFKVASIDKLSKDLLASDDEDVKNLAMLNTLKESLQTMAGQIKAIVLNGLTNDLAIAPKSGIFNNLFTDPNAAPNIKYTALEVDENAVINNIKLSETIAIIKDPNPQSNTFDDTKNKIAIDDFNTKFGASIIEFNKLVVSMSDVQINDVDLTPSGLVATKALLNDSNSLVDEIKNGYNVDDVNVINSIHTRLSLAAGKITDDGSIKFYDFTDLMQILNVRLTELDELQKDLTKAIGVKLQAKITATLGFSSSVRNIVEIFTAHVEVFLEQLFEVSAKAFKDSDGKRIAQLKKWKNKLDVHKDSPIIYPWPEYNENNIEKYLGANGVLEIPNDVPEIAFVEEMYQAMIRFDKVEGDINRILTEGSNSWYAFNPIDSQFFNSGDSNPYQRLGGNPQPDDIARLITLRAAGFMGFSNFQLTPTEITNFAIQEANLVLKQFKISDNNLIKLLNQKYTSPETYANVTGTINATETKVLVAGSNNTWKYNYIYEKDTRKILPVSGGFNNGNYNIALNNESQDNVGFKLSSLDRVDTNTTFTDTANYLTFVKADDYERASSLPPANKSSEFNYAGMKKSLTINDMEGAGFNANAGLYGVQEYTAINYGGFDGVNKLSFYTLFYDNGNYITDNNPSTIAPSLCKARSKSKPEEIDTQWDLATTIKLPRTSGNPDASSAGGNTIPLQINDFSYGKITSIYRQRPDIGRNIFLLSETKTSDDVTYPFVSFGIMSSTHRNLQFEVQMSLFGSRFYNAQETVEAKTLLFLHTLPWRGLINKDRDGGLFSIPETINAFQFRTGFVQVPKLYPAFIGAMLWRYRQANDPIRFKANTENILPYFDNGTFGNNLPSKGQYLRTKNATMASPMCFDDSTGVEYCDLDSILIELPEPAKLQFINEFLSFVEEYKTLRTSFEIHPLGSTIDGDDTTWKTAWDNINGTVTTVKNANDIQEYNVPLASLTTNLSVSNDTIEKRFKVLSFIPKDDDSKDTNIGKIYKYNYFTEFDEKSLAAINLKQQIFSYKYMSNDSWRMWNGLNKGTHWNTPEPDVTMSTTNFSTYMDEFIKNIKNVVADDEKQKFNNNNSNEIKLEIYRMLKKIYDKWVAASDKPEKILFQCCKAPSDRLGTDSKRKIHRLKQKDINATDGSNPTLIDSFRFVTRSFRDIGDEFQINPVIISQMLLQSTNISFYDLISRLLTDNNFDFIALPSFVDYNDVNEIRSIFKPYPYYEAAKLAKTGPSFVCVYVGQTSSRLDFGSTSDHPNDGFDLNDPTTFPDDFKGPKKDWEDVGAAFVVKYGHQNQSLFRDISLDQAEFSETAESLQITDNIANQYSQTNQSYMGQNLYNVYSIRSYRVDVDMLGDAMIQPMMYFQLDNIPMFHGAYLITKVRHTLKPNHMSTLFSGVRIKANETPLIEASALYASLLVGYELPKARQGSVFTTGTNLSVMKNTKGGASASKSANYSSAGLSASEAANNQLLVKNFLKKNNISREIAAGIMGNIKKESGFDPLSSYDDINGHTSFGLIQWNSKSYNLTAVGTTIDSQMSFLLSNTAGMSKFLDTTAKSIDPFETGYQFARLVEVCKNCNVGYPAYLGDNHFKPYERGQFANDFYTRFNIVEDILYWPDPNASTVINKTETNIIIGDSQTKFISDQTTKAKMLSSTGSEAALWLGGVGVQWLIDAVKKYAVSPNIKNVVISIGTNGGFNVNDNISGLFNALQTKFPSAKYLIVQGSWGWGNNSLVQPSQVTTYYNIFKSNGAIIIEPPIGSTPNPHNNLPIYKTICSAIDAKIV